MNLNLDKYTLRQEEVIDHVVNGKTVKAIAKYIIGEDGEKVHLCGRCGKCEVDVDDNVSEGQVVCTKCFFEGYNHDPLKCCIDNDNPNTIY